jgi:hypothetical protein
MHELCWYYIFYIIVDIAVSLERNRPINSILLNRNQKASLQRTFSRVIIHYIIHTYIYPVRIVKFISPLLALSQGSSSPSLLCRTTFHARRFTTYDLVTGMESVQSSGGWDLLDPESPSVPMRRRRRNPHTPSSILVGVIDEGFLLFENNNQSLQRRRKFNINDRCSHL